MTVEEIVTLINMILGFLPAGSCAEGHARGAEVDITTVIRAVGFALQGCPE
ncbi:MAG: hypothetical protein N3C12_01715 [Candidatus Binatia bacterium]|nr:hypothetical protein [Candidatus Binatia bacterium]